MDDGTASRSNPATAPSLEGDLMGSIEEILQALAAVARGELEQRLVPKYDDTHPVGALALSVNGVVEALAEAKAKSAAYQLELEEKIGAIERQRTAIHELSTPIIELWKGVLCVPVIGILDSTRTTEMTATLLSAIVQKQARYALVDITGIEVMDTRVVDHFLRMARAVSLLGARCVLSGVHPNISQTIVHMGVELSGIETHRTMREALRLFVAQSSATKGKKPRRQSPSASRKGAQPQARPHRPRA